MIDEESLSFFNPAEAELAFSMPIATAGHAPLEEPKTTRNVMYGYARNVLKMDSSAASKMMENISLETNKTFLPVEEKLKTDKKGNKIIPKNYEGRPGRGLFQFTGESTRLMLNKERDIHNAYVKSLDIPDEKKKQMLIKRDFTKGEFGDVSSNFEAIPLFLRGKARELKLTPIAPDGSYDMGIWRDHDNWRKAMNFYQRDRLNLIISRGHSDLGNAIEGNKPARDAQGNVIKGPNGAYMSNWEFDWDRFSKDMDHYKSHQR